MSNFCCWFCFVFCTLCCRVCVCVRIVVSNTYCAVFFFGHGSFFFGFCVLCCQFLWIAHFWYKADNIGYRRQRKITTKNENRTQYVLDTTIRTQTQSRQHRVQKTKNNGVIVLCLLYPMLPALCLCAESGVQHIMCSVFVFCCWFCFVFCTLCCRLCVCVRIVVSNTYCVLFLFFVVVWTHYVLDTTIRTQTQSRQHRVQKTKEKNNKKQNQNTICVGHHYLHTNTKPTT
jgi:hypothetical protein